MSTDLSLSNSLTDLAVRIRQEHDAVAVAVRRSVEHTITAGELLIEAKDQLKHGQWLPWLREHCGVSERSAQVYMRLARNKGNPQLTADLTIEEALQAAADSNDPKAKFEKLSGPGTYMTPGDRALMLPKVGQAAYGYLELRPFAPDLSEGWPPVEIFYVRESTRCPGFYWVSHVDLQAGIEGFAKKPIRADAVKFALSQHTQNWNRRAEIKWRQVPADDDFAIPSLSLALEYDRGELLWWDGERPNYKNGRDTAADENSDKAAA